MNILNIQPFSAAEEQEDVVDLPFQTERFLRVCRCAQCSLDLPLLFFNALSLWDAHQGGNSYALLVRFQSLCRDWLRLSGSCVNLFQDLFHFGDSLSAFCEKTIANIQALPPLQQCTEVLTPYMRYQLAQMHTRAEYAVQNSTHFLDDARSIRNRMDNEIHPHAAVFQQMLNAQPPLIINTKWEHIEVEHCGFLAKNPAIDGLISSLKAARTAEDAARSLAGLHNVAERLWTQVQDALTSIGSLDGEFDQISMDIRSLNVFWTSTGQYLDDIEQSLSGAMDSSRLLSVRSRLESCAGQWKSIAEASQDIVKQLTEVDNTTVYYKN